VLTLAVKVFKID